MSYMKLVEFKVLCESNGIRVPDIVTRGIEAIDSARSYTERRQVRVLDLSAEQMRSFVRDESIRAHSDDGSVSSRGYRPGFDRVSEQAWAEVREQIGPALDKLVVGQRKKFERIVAPIVEGAQKYGFKYRTTSDEVVRAGDPKGMLAWRDVGYAWASVKPIAQFRVKLSQIFDVSPTWGEARDLGSIDPGSRNWSVCFAAGDEWSMTDGYHIEDQPSVTGLDWFAIAQGGLRLNTPTEVRAKIAERAKREGATLSAPMAETPLEPVVEMDALKYSYPTR